MKPMLVVANSMLLFLSLWSVLSGTIAAVPLAAVYGLAIGSLVGDQRPLFHKLTIALNGLYCFLGLVLLVTFYTTGTGTEENGERIFVYVMVLLALLLIPILNIVHIIATRLRSKTEKI